MGLLSNNFEKRYLTDVSKKYFIDALKTTCATWIWISTCISLEHDDVIKWKHFPRDWPFVWGIHRSPVNSPHKDQWHGALMFSLICVWINDWVNNRQAGDLRRYRAHYDVIVKICHVTKCPCKKCHVLAVLYLHYAPTFNFQCEWRIYASAI